MPSLPSRWFKRTEAAPPASLPITDTITGLEPRVHLDVQVGPRISWLTQGLLLCPIYSGAFSSHTCTILGATGKATIRRFTQAFLCCWDGQIFSHRFLVVPKCPTPLMGRDILTKLGTTLVMGSFSAPRALLLLVTTEESITPSPIENKDCGRTKLTPRCGVRGFLDEPTKLNWSLLSSEIPLGFLTGNNILSKEAWEGL